MARAEQLRMLMLTASDPVADVRLRGFIQKYRDLADRARETVQSQARNGKVAI
jgi:hypothetical protein